MTCLVSNIYFISRYLYFSIYRSLFFRMKHSKNKTHFTPNYFISSFSDFQATELMTKSNKCICVNTYGQNHESCVSYYTIWRMHQLLKYTQPHMKSIVLEITELFCLAGAVSGRLFLCVLLPVQHLKISLDQPDEQLLCWTELSLIELKC